MYHFKSDFRKRLIRLYNSLGDLLCDDLSDTGFRSTRNLFPFFYQVFSKLYCTNPNSYLKKVK